MKFENAVYSKRFLQTLILIGITSLIVYGIVIKVGHIMAGQKTVPESVEGPIYASATLSHSKVLQGSDGQIYLQVDLQAPQVNAMIQNRLPTDFVVVLDRSGSMAGANKMNYAKEAIKSLVHQMGSLDRFALVTFDSQVEQPVFMDYVNPQNRNHILKQVDQITPRSNTNLSGGLMQGMSLLSQAVASGSFAEGRARRLILLSDGLANEGITDLNALNQIAARASSQAFVISTIGVGLDFNEILMSSLADHGTGNYYFLEGLASLNQVLAKEFFGASQVYAKNIQLEFNLPKGVTLIDATGYPIRTERSKILVETGNLSQAQQKQFFVTLKFSTSRTYSTSLGEVKLRYEVAGQSYAKTLLDKNTQVAVVASNDKAAVISSVNRPILERAWIENNYGNFQKSVSQDILLGNVEKAQNKLREYKASLGGTSFMLPGSASIHKHRSELESLQPTLDREAAAPLEERKRASKVMQWEGREKQRKSAH